MNALETRALKQAETLLNGSTADLYAINNNQNTKLPDGGKRMSRALKDCVKARDIIHDIMQSQ